MTEQEKRERVIKGLGRVSNDIVDGYITEPDMACNTINDAIALLKAQSEVIEDLLKVGYPHNFQKEEPWIVNYMYAITSVIKKAVNLKNDSD